MNDNSKNQECPKSYSREELYDIVWSSPMTKLAKEHGLSDNGLRKKCKKYNIPLPTAGYWAKKQFGKEGPRPPLPTLEGPNLIEIRNEAIPLGIIQQPQSSEPEEVQRQIAHENLYEHHIQVLATLSTPHLLISQFKSAWHKGKRLRPDRVGIVHTGREYLDIRVTQNSLDRALRVMNALIKAADKRNFKIATVEETSNYSGSKKRFMAAQVIGENVGFCLREVIQQKKKVVKPDKAQSKASWHFTEYDYIPTGMLTLSITERTSGRHRLNWTDGTKQKIENCLNDFMIALVRTAVFKRNDNLERQRRERERIDQQIRWYEEEKRRKEEEARLQELIQEVTNWRTSLFIRSYVNALKRAESEHKSAAGSESSLQTWMTWAIKQAEKLDPLKSRLSCD